MARLAGTGPTTENICDLQRLGALYDQSEVSSRSPLVPEETSTLFADIWFVVRGWQEDSFYLAPKREELDSEPLACMKPDSSRTTMPALAPGQRQDPPRILHRQSLHRQSPA